MNMSKIFKSFLFLILLSAIWHLVSLQTDLLPKISLIPTVRVPLSGTGSMYPTIPKGTGSDQENANQTVAFMNMYRFTATPSAFNKLFYQSQLIRGDIISFQNSITDKIEKEKYGKVGGFVKRVVGLSGETVELKGGIVYIDSIGLREEYTSLPHSTFGGDFLPDCTPLKIPAGKIFVMGDNRKQSNDSRDEIGLISLSDIHFVLPWDKQTGSWDKNFRSTSMDLDPSTKIITDKQQFFTLLNSKRQEKNLTKLTYNLKLEKSATLRAQTMISTNDFSFEATRSGQNQRVTMAKAGYWNPYYGEDRVIGYYTAQELIDNIFAFDTSEKFVLDPKFDDLGIGIVEGNINNCPTQVIVTQYAGFVPPDYSKQMIDSWTKALANLREIAPEWAKYKDYPGFAEINRIIDLRLNRLPPIVTKLQNQQWLTDLEEKLLEEDITLSKQQNDLADRLNTN